MKLLQGFVRAGVVGGLLLVAVVLGSQVGEAAPALFQTGTGEIYDTQCAPCHGADGEGGIGPSLQDSTMTDAELLAIIRDGSSLMPSFGPTLTAAQIDSLVSYSATLARDGTAPVDGTGADLELGTEVYGQQCAGCHGASGEGGVAPSLLSSSSTEAEQLAIIRDGRAGMPAFGTSLSGDQLAAVAAFSASRQQEAPDEPLINPIHRGARVYADNCANCHGADAAGGAGPNLKTASSGDEMAGIISHGVAAMPGFAGRLEPDDIGAVVAFLEELADLTTEPHPDDGPPDPARGASLFSANCSSCHDPDSDASGALAPALSNTTLTEAEMVAVIRDGRGAMPGFSAVLNNADTDAIVAYMVAARSDDDTPASPTTGADIYRATCAACHGADAHGGVGPALAGTSLTANEVVFQVFGGHPQGMPAFEGVLDATQVRDVARHVLSLEGEADSRMGLVAVVILAVGLVVAALVLWYNGTLRRLLTPRR